MAGGAGEAGWVEEDGGAELGGHHGQPARLHRLAAPAALHRAPAPQTNLKYKS